MRSETNIKSNTVAVLGFHDASAGQIDTWFEEASGYRIAYFVYEAQGPFKVNVEMENKKRVSQRTEYPIGNTFKGRPLIVSLDWIERLKELGIQKVLPLTPDNRERLKQIEACRKHNLELVSAIHPSVIILPGATIEQGVWINAGSIIGYKAEIQTGVIIEVGALINHHNVVERCSQVGPGVVAAGYVTFRECCYVYSGATIINRKEIGKDSIIGAGAVVIDDIPSNCTAVGVPAKVIKYH